MLKRMSFVAVFALALTAWAADAAKPAHEIKFATGGRGLAAAAMMPGGKQAVVVCKDQTLRFVDLGSDKETLKVPMAGPAKVLAVTTDGKNIVVGGGRGPLQILDAAGKLVKELAKDTNVTAISADGSVVATVVMGGSLTVVTLFNIPDGNKLSQVTLKAEPASLSFSKDHAFLAIGLFSGANNVLLADVKTGNILKSSEHGKQQVYVILSPDGKTIAANGNFPENEGLKLIDVASGKLTPVAGADRGNTRMDFSPDGKTLYYTKINQIQVIDVATAKITGTVGSGDDQLTFMTVISDGKQLLEGRQDTLRLWDLGK